VGAWAEKHWFLTFILVGAVLFTIRFAINPAAALAPYQTKKS
jgi:hypothetical protein